MRRMWKHARGKSAFARMCRDTSGAMALEMALGYFTMILMLFAMMEASMMAYTYSLLMDGAKEGVRYATVHGVNSSSCQGPSSGCDSTAANVTTDVTNFVTGLGANVKGITVTTTYPDGDAKGGSRVQVVVTSTYKPMFTIKGVTYPTFAALSAGRIVY